MAAFLNLSKGGWKMYLLYVHTVPNGKIYIGMTKDADMRWKNGKGYNQHYEFFRDIEKYGWENIKHEIIDVFEDEETCHQQEILYIVMMNSENPEIGYNKTCYRYSLMKKYNEKNMFDGQDNLCTMDSVDNIFEVYNKSYDMAVYLIDQWIFNELHRQIVKDRLLNGLSMEKLSHKYDKSIAQIKRIVYESQKKLVKHM